MELQINEINLFEIILFEIKLLHLRRNFNTGKMEAPFIYGKLALSDNFTFQLNSTNEKNCYCL